MKLSAPCPVCNSSKWCGRACSNAPTNAPTMAVDWLRAEITAGDAERKAARQKAARRRSKETGVLVGVRLQPDLLAKLDARCESQGIGRPEAIRAILEGEL